MSLGCCSCWAKDGGGCNINGGISCWEMFASCSLVLTIQAMHKCFIQHGVEGKDGCLLELLDLYDNHHGMNAGVGRGDEGLR